eukprot:c13668_g1_i1 orf=264-1265(-)
MNSLLVQRAGGTTKQALSPVSCSSSSSIFSAAQRPCVLHCTTFRNSKWASLKWVCRAEQQARSATIEASASSSDAVALARPSPAEAARTLVDVCNEGVICTSSVPDGWPVGSAVRFSVEPAEGSPFFYLHPSTFHSQHLQADCRCSLHIQMEQPGHRKPQCTFKGRASKVEDVLLKQKLRTLWCRRFGEEPKEEDFFYLMSIESVLQSLDIGEDNVWVSNVDYRQAAPDPLRDCAAKIVEDINRNHWEDVRRFCNVYAHLDLSVQEARLSWVDRLGFDMRVLTTSHELVEVRIPFSREVLDERDARSSLTMMAQISWEYERNYNPPEIQLVRS